MAENGDTEEEFEWPKDKDIEEAIAGLDLSTLTPDDLDIDDESSQASDPSSRGASVDGRNHDTASVGSGQSGQKSVTSEQSEQKSVTSDLSGLENMWMEDKDGNLEPIKERVKFNTEEKKDKEEKKKSVTKNPFKYLQRKLSRGELLPMAIPENDITKVKIDSLPQQFVTKYLGCRPCIGVQGMKYIRKPVDTMVKEVSESDKKTDLPLVQLTIWSKGIQTTLHPKTTNRDFQPHVMPIEYISYAVQDTKYYKIVAFINVTELTPKTQKVECHAYICDSPITARKLTLSVAKAFQVYAGNLKGKEFQFKVDLRTPEDIRIAKRKSKGLDCDA